MLFRNTLAQSAPTIAAYVFSVVLAPIMLARLGLAQFGIWAVTGALATYASLLDLGISRALARYVAYYDAKDDRRGAQECVGLGLIVVTMVGLVAAGAATVSAPLLASSLGVLETSEMRLVLLSSVAILTLNTLGSVFDAVPIGLQRMVPPNVVATGATFGNFVFSVVALAFSTELTVYALANAAASVMGLLLAIGSFVYVWARPYVALPSWARAREIAGFGLKAQVSWLSDLVNMETDKILIALIVGPQAAGAYEIGSRVVQAARSLGVMTVAAIIPTATAAIVKQGRRIVADFYRRYTMFSVSIAFPLFGLICVCVPFLLVAWLGRAPQDSALIVVLLSAAYFVNIATGVASTLIISDGRPGEVAWTSALTAVLNLIGTVALAPLFGTWGVLAATFISVTFGSLLLIARFHHIYELPVGLFVRSAGPPAVLTIGLGLPFLAGYIAFGGGVEAREAAILGLLITAGTYTVVYWLAASRLGYLPDRLSAMRIVRRGRGAAA